MSHPIRATVVLISSKKSPRRTQPPVPRQRRAKPREKRQQKLTHNRQLWSRWTCRRQGGQKKHTTRHGRREQGQRVRQPKRAVPGQQVRPKLLQRLTKRPRTTRLVQVDRSATRSNSLVVLRMRATPETASRCVATANATHTTEPTLVRHTAVVRALSTPAVTHQAQIHSFCGPRSTLCATKPFGEVVAVQTRFDGPDECSCDMIGAEAQRLVAVFPRGLELWPLASEL